MPLNAAAAQALAATVCANLGVTADPALTASEKAAIQSDWETVFTDLFSSIVANGTVVVTSVSGVTVGAGTSGPGTGTIV